MSSLSPHSSSNTSNLGQSKVIALVRLYTCTSMAGTFTLSQTSPGFYMSAVQVSENTVEKNTVSAVCSGHSPNSPGHRVHENVSATLAL